MTTSELTLYESELTLYDAVYGAVMASAKAGLSREVVDRVVRKARADAALDAGFEDFEDDTVEGGM